MVKKILGNLQRGLAFVISAPAGTGKTTLAGMLCQEFPCVVESISFTTRSPRGDEKDGEHYIFLSQEEFEKKIKAKEFLEYVKLFGHYYGTSLKWVEENLEEGKHVLLTIDTQGAMKIKGQFPASFIFIMPPNLAELKKRLVERNTETADVIEERLFQAKYEMEVSKNYDYVVVNDDLKVAYQVLRSILIADERRQR